MKIIIIDPVRRLISEEEVKNAFNDGKTLCGFDIATPSSADLGRGTELWVDDEGLMKSGSPCFKIQGGIQPYAGKAFLTSESGSKSPKLTLMQVAEKVEWTNLVVR